MKPDMYEWAREAAAYQRARRRERLISWSILILLTCLVAAGLGLLIGQPLAIGETNAHDRSHR